MSTTTATLAESLRQHRPTSGRRGYPQWLRDKVGRYVLAQRSAGGRLARISEELDISTASLLRWARLSGGNRGGGFIEVVAEPSAPAAQSPRQLTPITPTVPTTGAEVHPSAVYLVSPQGFSLHGLTFEQGIQALASLR